MSSIAFKVKRYLRFCVFWLLLLFMLPWALLAILIGCSSAVFGAIDEIVDILALSNFQSGDE